MMSLKPEKLQRLVYDILTTRPDEIGCDTCFAQLDLFVEMLQAGKNPAVAMPQVHRHLERCGMCREEFEALLSALEHYSQLH